MSILLEYERASRELEEARLRRIMALRAMSVSGLTQAEIARSIGVSQPAVSQQLAHQRLEGRLPHELVEAGSTVLREFAIEQGFKDLAIFGSVARGEDRIDSDIDILVTPPPTATLTDLLQLEEALSLILGRVVDLVSRKGLDPRIDADVLRDEVKL